ncbi:hypothetical protein IAD21_01288 [Abditibacteriota bacterium]|nr:hypothetical protein IAD21_01288 [Abditibacteriota bacterium]
MKLFSLRYVVLAGALFLGRGNTRAQAATFTVSNLNDGGIGSLRQAIADANATPDADSIGFASAIKGTLTLTSGELIINSDISIIGPTSSLTLSGNRTSRLFTITKGNVFLSNLTLANGFIKGEQGTQGPDTRAPHISVAGGPGGSAHGGAIFNQGILSLTDVSLKNNTAQGGAGGQGGVRRYSPTMGATFGPGPGGQGGPAKGGAVFNIGTLKLLRTQFQENIARGGQGGNGGWYIPPNPTGPGGVGGNAYGGAIFNGGAIEIENSSDSSFVGNRAIAGLGGVGLSVGATGTGFDNDIRDVVPSAQDVTFSGTVAVSFRGQLVATGGEDFTYSIVSGTLPKGLALNPLTGIISGVPTVATNSRITYRVSDGARSSNTALIIFSIRPSETRSLVVTTLSDAGNISDGFTSLREAVEYAHTLPGSPTITFATGLRGTISLLQQGFSLNHNLSIVGPPNSAITLDVDFHDRLFYIKKGTANIANLTLTRGDASALLNESTLNLANCTVTDSFGDDGGGGLYNKHGGTVTVSNCTFVNNKDTGSVAGGGIYNAGTMTIDSSTFWKNTCIGGRGGGIYNGGQLVLRNSIVASSSARFGPDIYGAVTGSDYNLVQNPTGATLTGTHNITGKAPNLGPLRDNGGPTFTMALLAGSPAIDTGQTTLKTDQRGLARPAGKAADIGAFESPLPVISVNSPSVREGNGDTATPSQLVFTLTLDRASEQSVSLVVQSANASTSPATAKSDYVPIGRTRVVFAPGQTRQTVSIAIVGDMVYEDNERVGLLLSAPIGASLATSTGEGTILNDDAIPSLSINDISVTEGNSGFSKAIFTVTLSGPSDHNISVGYKTYSNGRGVALGGTSTTPGMDYLSIAPTTLLFLPGQTSKTIMVLIKGDTVVETDESFNVLLSAPVNARIADGAGLGTILNDDSSASTTNSVSAPTS